ncbi:MAG: hypothetical protein Q7V63_09900 [Gammaproteobacteria bacterium]|nr:hypothetical protein [Gammaproteobacteria bacterium]
MTNLYQKMIDYDPGLVKFKQGFKSVLALVFSVTLIISWSQPIGLVLAGLTGVFVGVNHTGETLRAQKWNMVLAAMYFTGAIGLGLALQSYFWVANSVLVILSFLGFYLARFGSQYRAYPIAAAIMYLLSINFIIGTLSDKLLIVAGVLIAGLMMFVVYFYMWPEKPKAELKSHIESLLTRYIACVECLKLGMERQKIAAHGNEVDPLLGNLEWRLQQEFLFVERSNLASKKEALESLIVKQYALYILLDRISGWLKEISAIEGAIDEQHQKWIVCMLSQLIVSLSRLKLLCNAPLSDPVINAEFIDAAEHFKVSVFGKDRIPNASLINYSYLAFGFERVIILLGLIQSLIIALELPS